MSGFLSPSSTMDASKYVAAEILRSFSASRITEKAACSGSRLMIATSAEVSTIIEAIQSLYRTADRPLCRKEVDPSAVAQFASSTRQARQLSPPSDLAFAAPAVP